MKRIVWANKSNGQLCVTVPKESGIQEGDWVNLEKSKIKTIVYSSTTGDLFNYGQLQLLQKANSLGDFHACGVLTDEAITSYRMPAVAGLKERLAVVSSLNCVDMVLTQNHLDPTENLHYLHQTFPHAKIILVYGSNWKKIPGKPFISKIGGTIKTFPYYEKLSNSKIIRRVIGGGEP